MPAFLGIILAITGGAIGQLLMKSGLQTITLTDLNSVFYNMTHHPLPSLLIATGILCYVLSMAIWVLTLKTHPLNQAIPYLSLSYVLVYLLATVWPGIEEQMTLQKSVGVSLIIVGVWYTQSTDTSKTAVTSKHTNSNENNSTSTSNQPANKHAC